MLHLRLHHLMKAKSVGRAPTGSACSFVRLRRNARPDFLHGGYCLHQLGKTKAARQLLLKGPVALLKEPIYYYNMGCYEALLGNIDDAKVNLKISFEMDASFRDLAKRDPDLQSIQALL